VVNKDPGTVIAEALHQALHQVDLASHLTQQSTPPSLLTRPAVKADSTRREKCGAKEKVS
jgi:hypothetical protein